MPLVNVVLHVVLHQKTHVLESENFFGRWKGVAAPCVCDSKKDTYFFSFPEMDLYSVKKSCVGWWNPSILENGKLVSGFWKGWNPWFQITSTFCLQLLLTRQVKTTKDRNCSTFFILTKKVEFMDSFHLSETNRGYNFKDCYSCFGWNIVETES